MANADPSKTAYVCECGYSAQPPVCTKCGRLTPQTASVSECLHGVVGGASGRCEECRGEFNLPPVPRTKTASVPGCRTPSAPTLEAASPAGRAEA
jgi:hypothetical protein